MRRARGIFLLVSVQKGIRGISAMESSPAWPVRKLHLRPPRIPGPLPGVRDGSLAPCEVWIQRLSRARVFVGHKVASNNSIMVIRPYWDHGTWVFDDYRVGL